MKSPKDVPVLRLEQLELGYTQGPRLIKVLQGASASFFPGQTVALLGPSGAGKSTLLHVAGLLEKPDRGAVVIDAVDCTKLSDSKRTRRRRNEIGFIYQFHHLLPEFSALENVILPQLILGRSRREAETRAKELLNYRWFQKSPWQKEIKRMLSSGLKYELDALANKDFQYLTKKYLPRKLKEKDWLD